MRLKLALTLTLLGPLGWMGCRSSPIQRESLNTDLNKDRTTFSAKARYFFYKAEKGPSVVFLFGSFHVGKAEFYPLPRVVEGAFAQSQVLAVEVDLSQAIGEVPPSKKTPTAEALLEEKSLQKLRSLLAQNNLPQSLTHSVSVARLNAMLIGLRAGQAGYQAKWGVDRYFMDKAIESHKLVVELEGAAAQFAILEALPVAVERLSLVHLIENWGSLQAELDDLALAWRQGNDEALLKGINAETYGLDEPDKLTYLKTLFGDRNHAMTLTLIGLLKSYPRLFVTVGAGHMVGTNGLPKLLEKNGFKLARIAAD